MRLSDYCSGQDEAEIKEIKIIHVKFTFPKLFLLQFPFSSSSDLLRVRAYASMMCEVVESMTDVEGL